MLLSKEVLKLTRRRDVQLGIDPNMLGYLDELYTCGIAYHTSMDQIDFMSPELVKNETVEMRVELFCPSFSLCLWRAFYSNEIVGIKVEQPVAAALHFNRLVPNNAHTLLDWCNERLETWSLGGFPHLISTQERVSIAIDMHLQARAFLQAHPQIVSIPPTIHTKMVALWRTKSSPSARTH